MDEQVPEPMPGECPVCGAVHPTTSVAEVVPCIACGAWCRQVDADERKVDDSVRLRAVTALALTIEGNASDPIRCIGRETSIGGSVVRAGDLALPGLDPSGPAAVVIRDGETFRIRAVGATIRLDGQVIREAPIVEGSRIDIGPHALLASFLGPWDSEPVAAELTLVVSRGPDRGKRFVVSEDMVAGRSDGCGIQLLDRDVSRRHARFVRRGSAFVVQDLGSTNGTRIGGRRIAMALIRNEVQIQLGEDVFDVAVRPLENRPLAPPEPPLELEIVSGPGKGARFSRREWPFLIGSGEDADVKLPDPKVSIGHAVVERHGDSFLIRDLESRRGTYVDEQRASVAPLFHGSRIDLGKTRMTVSLSGGTNERPEMYKVVWRARIVAEDPANAARLAWELMRGSSPTSLRFLAIHAMTGAACIQDLGQPAGPLHLVVTSGPAMGTHACVDRSPTTIGREGSDLIVKDPRLSDAHAVLERHGASWFLRDLDGDGGSWVDGQRVPMAEIRDGSRIGLGDTSFLVRIPDSGMQLVNEQPARDVPSTARCFDVMWSCRKPGTTAIDACRNARQVQREGTSQLLAVDDPVKQERRFFVLQSRSDELVEVGAPSVGMRGSR